LANGGYCHAEELAVGDKLVAAVAQPVLEPIGGMSLLPAFETMPTTITAIEVIEPTLDEANRFDIEVEGNHCYIANGNIVHNSPETTTGGRALKFYASVRLDIRRVESIKQGDEVIGNRTKVRVTKNKVAAPFREAEFDIMFYEGGISKMGEILDLGVNLNIIEKRGAFLRYNDGLLGQGRENAKQFLRENRAIADEIEDQIRAYYGLPAVVNLPAAHNPPTGDGKLFGDE
jgi:recombination protein RecA